jgi:hypothetical protein
VNAIAAGALIVGVACLLAALLIGFAGTGSTPADRAPTTQHRARDASEPDVTILGPRADNDGIFGTYPSLRVVDRLSPDPPVSNPEGTTSP